jgi:putative phosphoesterase
MNVAIISDTHIPSRAQSIPGWARQYIREADHVIHAGDFDSTKALADVRQLAPRMTAVGGNMDPRGLDLPDVETVRLGGVTFVVTHGTGSRRGYEERVAEIVTEHAPDGPTVGVAGHTHELMDTLVDGVRLLNPGSVTGAAPADEATMLTADVSDGEIDVTVQRDS